MAQANKEEAELQKETEVLIEKMHEQASVGEIPEFGKKIIDVLQNYQGMYMLCTAGIPHNKNYLIIIKNLFQQTSQLYEA